MYSSSSDLELKDVLEETYFNLSCWSHLELDSSVDFKITTGMLLIGIINSVNQTLLAWKSVNTDALKVHLVERSNKILGNSFLLKVTAFR